MADLFKIYKNLSQGEVVLDIRTPEEYAEGHVPGSINIDHEEIGAHLEKLKGYKKIYMHCRSGGRVRFTRDALKDSGLQNITYIDSTGMMAWADAGYPVEK